RDRGATQPPRGERHDVARLVVRQRRHDGLGRDGLHGPHAPRDDPEGGAVGRDLTAEDRELRTLLGDVHTIAVVGLASWQGRRSFEVARYLQRHGYRIVPVNPNETEVLGERAYPTLRDLPADLRIDVVDVFRRAEHTPEVARDAIAIGAKVLWLQED